jgi:hypothetical protein
LDFADVAGGTRFASDWPAEVIDKNEVILGAAGGVREDAVENFEHFAHTDVEAGFFQDLASGGVAKLLAKLEDAAGNGPLALEGLGVTTDKKSATILDNDGSDADYGMLGVVALHTSSSLEMPVYKVRVSSFQPAMRVV